MIKLKRIKAGEYNTLDGKFLIRKNYMLNLWFAGDIKTLESVVDCEKSLRKIRESLERYLMSSEISNDCKDNPESSTDPETTETATEIELETAEDTEEALDILINRTTEATKSSTEEKIPDLSNFHNAIIKAFGVSRAKEVRYTVQGVNVFFEFKRNMYKCFTPQSKLYKLSGQRFNLITWRDLKKEATETGDNSDVIYTARPPPESSSAESVKKNKLIKERIFKMNKFFIKGYIGNIECGKTYTKVSIATTRNFKNKKGEYETDWFNCLAFNATSDFISNYFSKGDMILCEGNIQNDNFTDDDGHIHYGFSFIIQSVEFCGTKNSEKQESNSRYGNAVNNKYKKK